MKAKVLVFTVLLLVVFTLPTFAATKVATKAATATDDQEKAKWMFARGVVNLTTGLAEIPVQTVKGVKDKEGVLKGICGGIAGCVKGVGRAIYRVGNGVFDMVTCWYPKFRGYPMEEATLFEGESVTSGQG